MSNRDTGFCQLSSCSFETFAELSDGPVMCCVEIEGGQDPRLPRQELCLLGRLAAQPPRKWTVPQEFVGVHGE